MSNLPENDNLTPREENPAENEPVISAEEETDSTVFSAPAEHKSVPVKKKKLFTKILTGVLCLAVLAGGTVGIIKLIPKRDTSVDPGYAKDIPVLALETDAVKEVTFTNEHGTVNLYGETEKTSASSGSSSSGDDAYVWYVKGIDKAKISTSTTNSKVYNAVTLTASREITAKTAADCGLEKPSIQVDVVPLEGSAFTITVGDKSPDNSGYYMQLSSTGKIYVISADVRDGMNFSALDMADAAAMPAFPSSDDLSAYFTDGSLSDFDKLTISGKNYPEMLTLINNKDTAFSSYIGYMTTTPSVRISDNTDGILNIFSSGVSAAGAYSYDNSTAEQKKYGLDSPDLTARMDMQKHSMTFRFKLQKDGYYAAVCDGGSFIYKVSADILEDFIDKKATDYYSSWICYNAISDISNFTVKANGKTYSFGVAAKEDTASPSSSASSSASSDTTSSETETKEYKITYGGKELVALNFQKYYQYCVTQRCVDFAVEKNTTEPELSLSFTFIKGKTSTIDFRKSSVTEYQYSVDGVAMGKVAATSVSKMIKYAEKCANGETINEIV